ncbi:polysaccharide deacetylase family protein [Bacteroidia bacterium]|nr:polysaccharide deacetylase family protein [Bacteroidia bacterium]
MNNWSKLGYYFFPQLTWRREVTSKQVFLTFDDGPHPDITPWVMDALAQVGAKATFFIVGENAQRHFELIAQLTDAGHHVANHTFKHLKGWRTSTKKYVADIADCEDYIKSNTLFRPPYGQIKYSQIRSIQSKYEIIMWDILSRDYLPNLNVRRALRRIKKATRPGSIVVFHDSVKAEKNVKSLLPAYLLFLKEEGYTMSVL